MEIFWSAFEKKAMKIDHRISDDLLKSINQFNANMDNLGSTLKGMPGQFEEAMKRTATHAGGEFKKARKVGRKNALVYSLIAGGGLGLGAALGKKMSDKINDQKTS